MLGRLKWRIKNLRFWFRTIWNDQPWDFAYLLYVERRKLEQMSEYFTKTKMFVGVERQIERINLCIKLIDIFLQEGEETSGTKSPYINHKNYYKFLKNPDSPLETLRAEKALYLYHMIKYRYLQYWWD